MRARWLVLLALVACSSGPSPAPPAPAVKQVSWNPVTTLTDGSALDDLTGYQVSYGRLGATPQVTEATSTATTLSLPSGVWQVQVAAVSASKGVGLLCPPVSTTVP
jgi:hypothetical protein